MKIGKVSKDRMYQIVIAPVVTEKSTLGSEHSQVTFEVARDATKQEIAAAIQGLFDVKVVKVNTLRQVGKLKRFKGYLGRRAETKKAMVTLAKGQSIDVTAGI